MFCRLKLRLGNHALGFGPDKLSDADLAGTTLKRAQAGAFFENVSKLECNHAGVIWEVQLSFDPPATVKPVKPKYWLLGSLTMEPEKIYKLL